MSSDQIDPRAESVRAWAPATIGNLVCGFDVLGLAIGAPGDLVTARRARKSGVTVTAIHGDGGLLPLAAERNTASIAANALLRLRGSNLGAQLEIEKGVPLAGGLGSSAASAVAAVVAVDALLALGASSQELFLAAVEAEGVNCGTPHGDNVAPCLLGGCTLARPGSEPEAVPLPCPPGLAVAVLHPAVKLTTRSSRQLLPNAVPLADAVVQWANVGSLVAALHSGDLSLLRKALEDRVSEPARAAQIPGFAVTQAAALQAGALGASLSGAGPSIFALCESIEIAQQVATAMGNGFSSETGLDSETYSSEVDRRGARVLTGDDPVRPPRAEPL
jgi:homoserine kinase